MAVTVPVLERAQLWWRTWWTRGSAPRALPPELFRTVYLLWVLALAVKMLGSSWDISWHFRWLRDDLAPPHLLNSAGTALVIALVLFHSYTGYGVDRRGLHLMQAGTVIFMVAIPIDVINHRVNGLDITAWTASHGLLFLGTAVMIAGVLRGWWLYAPPDRSRGVVLAALWVFFLENVWFPAQQQEYGVLGVAAWDRGRPDAEPSLLQFAADQQGRPIDRTAVLHYALPVESWVYPVWAVTAAALVLLLARWMVGWRWAATTVAAAYLAYRCAAWVLLVGAGFPPSALPFMLLAGAVAVDVIHQLPMPWWLRPLVGAPVVAGAVLVTVAVQGDVLVAPPTDFGAGIFATLGLAALWLAAAALARSAAFARWTRPA
ncbi:MAG: hypothetical protein JWR88_2112 [Pseudonocardia sp.]|nr:hypothetical protein [Pseudonocardia sp.]